MAAPATERASAPGAGLERAQRNAKFDGIRGLCALGVLLFHVSFHSGVMGFFWNTGDGFLGAITYNLNVSLPPFLVMSGLLLYRPFARAIMTDKPRPSAKTFLVRRGMRILPAYWILCAVAIPLLNSYPGEGFWAKVRPFLLIHTFWPKSDEISGMSTTWFVTTEFTFYLLLPVFAWAIARYARRAVDPWQRAKRMLVPLSLLLVVGFG